MTYPHRPLSDKRMHDPIREQIALALRLTFQNFNIDRSRWKDIALEDCLFGMSFSARGDETNYRHDMAAGYFASFVSRLVTSEQIDKGIGALLLRHGPDRFVGLIVCHPDVGQVLYRDIGIPTAPVDWLYDSDELAEWLDLAAAGLAAGKQYRLFGPIELDFADKLADFDSNE